MKKFNLLIVFSLISILVLPALAKSQENKGDTRGKTQEEIEEMIERGEIGADESLAQQVRTTAEDDSQDDAESESDQPKDDSDATSSRGEGIKQKIKEGLREAKSEMGAEHRSEVANFVQSLLEVADRVPGGIGEKVREVARAQNQAEDEVIEALDKIKKRSKIRRFLFGTDNKAVKEIKEQMQEARKRLGELEQAGGSLAEESVRQELQEQIEKFREEVNKVSAEVQAEEGRFSLFGWAKRLFKK